MSGINLLELNQKLDRLIQNIAEQNRRAYQLFYDPNPQDVELPQLDENGNLVNVTIPNRAKILADFETWKEGARREFVGTQLVGTSWSDNVTLNSLYGNSGAATLTKSCQLKHDTNANGYTPTQSDLYDSQGNHLLTLPLHPSAVDKRATYPAVKVHVENMDTKREFFLTIPVINKNPFSGNDAFVSFGCMWFYLNRDVSIIPSFILAPEYMGKASIIIDGKSSTGDTLNLSAGWHYVVSLYKGGIVAWNSIDILRFKFSTNDSLNPLDIVLTHPSILANVHLSAIVEKA